MVSARPASLHARNFRSTITPRQGVVTLFGYGIRVQVERGHLVLEDGIGPDRRYARLPRVGHGLNRLVIIGSDGFVSLSALRWLEAQNACFVLLERDGSVLATTGPVRSSDARLRRSQALAFNNQTALQLAVRLINQKLAGQERVARERLNNLVVAARIAEFHSALKSVRRLEDVLSIEASPRLRIGQRGRTCRFNIRQRMCDAFRTTGKYSVRVFLR